MRSNDTKQLQVGFLAAEKFSDKAANLICQELDFQRAADWVYYSAVDIFHEYDWLILSNLYCGDQAGQFADCTYGMTHIKAQDSHRKTTTTKNSISSNLSHILLSCNPAPGEISIVYKLRLTVESQEKFLVIATCL